MSKISRKGALLLGTIMVGVLVLTVSACGGEQGAPENLLAADSTDRALDATRTPEPTTAATPDPTHTLAPQPTATSAPEPTPTPTPEPAPTQAGEIAEGPKAPELTGTQSWINSEPLRIQDLKGQVVLIDFWTYTCINCIRTFPYLKIWHSKYADDGLVIIGVHAPEFQFEHVLENVQQAVTDYAIDWPVVQDNDFETWAAFRNRYWPAKYLIDKDGIIRYTHFGEGAYEETETQIRDLLEEAGADLSLSSVDPEQVGDQELDPKFLNTVGADITAELYGGHRRGCSLSSIYSNSSVDDLQYCRSKDVVAIYEDTGDHSTHKLYLQGPWLAGGENLSHGRETSNFEDYMLLRFSAKSVNVVLKPEKDEPFSVLVTLDGEYLNDSNKGRDVVIEEDGRSFLHVDEPKLYRLIEVPSYGTYDVKLSSNSINFALFAFTFGVYSTGP